MSHTILAWDQGHLSRRCDLPLHRLNHGRARFEGARRPLRLLLTLASLLTTPTAGTAQGTLADYERADRFQPWKIRRVVFEADVNPQWIEQPGRFWYLRRGPTEKQFLLVNSSGNTEAAAF